MEEKKEASKRQRLANILNPLKTGENSKYLNPKVTRFLKDPTMLNSIILDSIEKLEETDLDPKERIMYINTLKGIYQAIFGNKNVNLNLDIKQSDVETKVYELLGKSREDIVSEHAYIHSRRGLPTVYKEPSEIDDEEEIVDDNESMSELGHDEDTTSDTDSEEESKDETNKTKEEELSEIEAEVYG